MRLAAWPYWFDSSGDTYTDHEGAEYNRIGEYYIMEGKNGYLIHRQNEVIAQVGKNQVSEGIAGQGIDGGDLLQSGDSYFSKQELFSWGYANDDVNNWIFHKASVDIQKEYLRYAMHQGMKEAAGPIAFTIGAPVALIGGAEVAVGVEGYFSLSNAIWSRHVEIITAEYAPFGDGSVASEDGTQIFWSTEIALHVGPNEEGTNVEGDQSTETALAHEFGHAWLAQGSPILNAGFERADSNDPDATNEHNWILKNIETPFAKARGEGQRAKYRGVYDSKDEFDKKATSGYGDYLIFKN